MNAHVIRWISRAIIMLVMVSGLAAIGLAEPALADGDVEWDTKLTYRLKVDEGAVNLVSDVSLTNRMRNKRRGNTITQFYIDRTWIYVPMEAVNVSITSGEKELAYSIDEDVDDVEEEYAVEGLDLLEIRFPKRIFYNKTIDIRVEYDIPGDDPRSGSLFRVNPAYSSFSVIAWGDPGRVEVVVILDDDFEIDAWGSEYETSREGTDVVYTINEIEDPSEWFMIFTARNDDQLSDSTPDLAAFDINVRAWPSDTVWASEVEASVEAGLPVMYDLIGLEWEPTEGLEIRESIEPNLLGYGGWYLDTGDVIEIGEYVDPHLVLHEISHSWFNEDLFIHRWITEGLAEEYAATTVESLGWSDRTEYVLDDDPPNRHGRASTALNEWVVPDGDETDVEDSEEYGYTASWWVIHEIVGEIGIDGLSAVIAAADADQIAYVDGGEPESVEPRDDWRRLLDLLQEVGGSDLAPALFEERVLSEEGSLDTRSETRSAYAELLSDAGEWSMPIVVREPMSDWDFEAAEQHMAMASQVLDVRGEIQVLADALGIVPPPSLRKEYEATTTGFESSLSLALEQQTAAELVLQAQNAVEAEPGLMQQIGLIGEDPQLELHQAVVALEADDLATANAEADDALTLLAAAEGVGKSRTAKTSAGLFALLALTIGLVTWTRRRRRKRAGKAEAPGEDMVFVEDDELLAERPADGQSDATAPDPM